jgi:hypothetical protein
MRRLTVLTLLAATAWPAPAPAATELNTRNSITVNEPPPVAPQPAEVSQPIPVSVVPRMIGAPPQPVTMGAPPKPQAGPQAPEDAPFKAGQPETPAAAPPQSAPAGADALPKAPSVFDEPAPPQPTNAVVLQGLNKVTGHISKINTAFNVTQRFGNLEITAKRCWKSAPEERPEDAVLLDIRELQAGEAGKRIFLGWMFSSSPGLSGLEHPVYDVNLLSCEFHPDVTPGHEDKPAAADKPTEKARDKPKKESRSKERASRDKPAAAKPDAGSAAKSGAPAAAARPKENSSPGPQLIKIP